MYSLREKEKDKKSFSIIAPYSQESCLIGNSFAVS